MTDLLKQLGTHGLVPVVTIENPDQAADLGAALTAGGLPVAEITFRTDGAAEAIAKVKAAHPDMLIGAGTVLTTAQAEAAVSAGATYIISPGLNPTTVTWCLEKNVLITPGICTPSDIERGLELGLSTFKFFPAGAFGGLKTLKAIAAPYRGVRFIPTGGVNADNLADYLSFAPVHACGGSWIVPGDKLAAGDFAAIETLTRDALEIVKSVRG